MRDVCFLHADFHPLERIVAAGKWDDRSFPQRCLSRLLLMLLDCEDETGTVTAMVSSRPPFPQDYPILVCYCGINFTTISTKKKEGIGALWIAVVATAEWILLLS